MTRRDYLHKWFVYTLGLLLVWLLDGHILPRLPIFGTTPMLLPLAAVAVAVLEGAFAGTGFGLAVGLLWELAYPGGFGGLVLFLALLGMAVGALSQYALARSLPGCLLCSAGTLAILSGMRIVRGLLNHSASFGALLRVAAPEFLLSMVCVPLIYLLFHSIYDRVGGTKLA